MKAIIMAGGSGTRISSIFPDIPKPLIPIEDVPVLEREIYSLASQGFKEIILTVSYLHEKIEEYFGDGTSFGVNISYYVERTPLGNAGALFKLRDELTEPFLLLNADSLFDVDFNRMVEYHKSHGGLVTLFTHPNSHPYDSGLIIAEKDKSVQAWLAKEDVRPKWYVNRVNAGLHVIDPAVLDSVDGSHVGEKDENGDVIKIDLDRQILKPLAGTGKMFCYDSPEYVKDMGTPERYDSVCLDFRNGIVSAKNLANRQKAVFLDRDGTINIYKGFLRDIDEFELIPGVTEAIRMINTLGYLAIVVTNQPIIARGEATWNELEEIHKKLETLLGLEGAYIDGLYFCPHHPHKGFEGEVVDLKIECDCRKPKPGMMLKAANDYNVNLAESWIVGDSINDVLAGKSAGCHTCYIGTDNDVDCEMQVKDLLSFVRKLENRDDDGYLLLETKTCQQSYRE